MQIKHYQIIFAAVALIGTLLFASPSIAVLVEPSHGQPFSVIYILGPDHIFDNIPFNVKAGVTYSVYLGVVNHMDSSSYYTCLVKLSSENDSFPNQTLGTPSSLPSLFEYKTFIAQDGTWEVPLTFQLDNLVFANNEAQLSGITINGVDLPINKVFPLDSSQSGYFCNLNVELWIFNSTLGTMQYHNRYVTLNLSLTE
jgi:hypothetical protein